MANIVGLFRRSNNVLETGGIEPVVEEKFRCSHCKSTTTRKLVANTKMTCPNCDTHFRIGARTRIKALCDKHSFQELFQELKTDDPLQFPMYQDKLRKAKIVSSEEEGVICGTASFRGEQTAIFVMEPQFMMGSMGCVVGEKITRLFEYATENQLPVVGFTCSGGARMQEGILSLMQMAKVSGAVERHGKKGGLYITVLTDPTTGGVTASFAMLGDIILSEPKATIGFAGQRVIEQTTKKKLPEGFQKAEFLLKHGFVDKIVSRKDMRKTIANILNIHTRTNTKEIANLLQPQTPEEIDLDYTMGIYDRVQTVRSTDRPTARSYINTLFTEQIEFHGDRKFADDKAIVGGIAWLGDMPVTYIGIERGATLEERIDCHFGSPMPEGYRKALRLMEQANKFKRPIICFVDTSGAFCGEDAEERGQGQAIADNLLKMMAFQVPIITIILGEGGSGGALGLSVANKVYMLENAVYSVISPEGCASILWEDASKVAEAAKCLCIGAEDMIKFGVAERVIPEQFSKFLVMCKGISECLKEDLKECFSYEDISEERYKRFRALGVIQEQQ